MDATLSSLTAWMPNQRWFASKGRAPRLRFVASWDLETAAGTDASSGAVLRTLLIADEATSPTVLYQVPVVIRPDSSADASASPLIGPGEEGTTLSDAPHDPLYTSALLRLIRDGGTGAGASASAQGHPAPHATLDAAGAERTAAVLRGEQSNTSIIYRSESGLPIICKVFRQIHPGLNPDIELQTALAEDGSPHVPPAVGSIEGVWPGAGGEVTGSLAFAQEFLPGAEDAWRVALRAAAAAEDFAPAARALGAATARVHLELAALFPVTASTASAQETISASWDHRLGLAIVEVPSLDAHRADIEAVYARAADADWPALQRVHGDYHLGQVIQAPGRDWVLLDFEGEPLRPMAERTAPDLALRDVAGMLRSFDYVAGSLRLEGPARPADAVAAWVASARDAFLTGYVETAGLDMTAHAALLAALELDKAVYETIYEARNRPHWVQIPLEAISRLTGRD